MTSGFVSWFLSVIVLVLLFLSGYIMKNSVHLLLTGKRAQGIVVGMDSASRSASGTVKAPLFTPIVEFVTSDGELIKVHGRSYSLKPSSKTGDEIKITYDKSNPKNAQLLLWGEFPLGPAGFLLGFAIILIMIWMGGILISNDPSLDDPLHLLTTVIAHFHLNPVRYIVLFVLFFAIPTCLIGTYWTSQRAIDMLANGIKAVGYVTGTERVYSKSNDGTTGSGVFPMITFKDASGTEHNIHGSTAKPLSRLKTGDTVEVIYLAGSPNRGVVNTWYEFWIPPMFFGFMAGAMLVLLVLVLSGNKSIVAIVIPTIIKNLDRDGESNFVLFRKFKH